MKGILYCLTAVLMSGVGYAQSADEFFKTAETKRRNGLLNEAIGLYDKAIAIDKDKADALYQRGFCYARQNEFEKAYIDYTRVLELKPGFLWAYISRGSALNKLKRFQEAMSDFNKALELDPENQEAYNNRGWAKKGLGDDKAACEDWKKSKKMGNEEAKIILGNSGCR